MEFIAGLILGAMCGMGLLIGVIFSIGVYAGEDYKDW